MQTLTIILAPSWYHSQTISYIQLLFLLKWLQHGARICNGHCGSTTYGTTELLKYQSK